MASTIDKVRALFKDTEAEQEYQPVESDPNDEYVRRPVLVIPDSIEEPFSWFEYSIFILLGIAMLWAW